MTEVKTEDILREAGLNDEQINLAGMAISHGAYQLVNQGRVPLQALILKESEDRPEPEIAMLACPVLEDEETKNMFMETVRYVAHMEQSPTVAIVMEAWTTADLPEEDIPALLEQYGSISKIPGAGEAICVMVNSDEGKYQVSTAIKRDDGGALAGFGKITAALDKDGHMVGRMIHSRYSEEDKADSSFAERVKYMEAYLHGRLTEVKPNPDSGDNSSIH